MTRLFILSAAGQVAAHLREELVQGRWCGTIPGVNRLAMELGVNRKTVEAGLRQLEREGLLAGQGPGRNRLVVPRGAGVPPRPLRVAILLGEDSDRHLEYIVELQHLLSEAGHIALFPDQSLLDLRMKVARVGRLVGKTAADAWVVMAAAREVLEWFGAQPLPAFALFGHQAGLPIAGTSLDKPSAYVAATSHLIGLGHRRIVLVTRRMGGMPEPRLSERAFLEELAAHGMAKGAFNLPVWHESREGLQRLLSSLFRVTPPTALMVDEPALFMAAQQFLAGRGLVVPRDVSLLCTDPDPAFAWCTPSIAHIRWDSAQVVRSILRWASAVARGRRDVRQTLVRAEFVHGGTIGPAPAP